MIIDWIRIKWYKEDSYLLHYVYPDPTESVKEVLEEYSMQHKNFSEYFYMTVGTCKDFIYELITTYTSGV